VVCGRSYEVVAVKIVQKFDESFVTRSKKEIDILHKLSAGGVGCEHIVRLIDHFEVGLLCFCCYHYHYYYYFVVQVFRSFPSHRFSALRRLGCLPTNIRM